MESMTVRGVGIDITEVSRVKRLYEKEPGFLKRFFTAGEAAYCLKGRNRYERIAARFSAKEAVIKALDRKNLPFRSISILKTGTGRPVVRIKGLAGAAVMLSLSHTARYACACAIVLSLPARAARGGRKRKAAEIAR